MLKEFEGLSNVFGIVWQLFSAGVKKKEENTTQTGRLRVQDAVGDVSRATQLQAHSFIMLYKSL
jgi:hypothetical protein